MPAVIGFNDEGQPLYWCGYEPNPATPGAGCHRWIPGENGLAQAVRFVDAANAIRSGVGAPNGPYGRRDTAPDRGVNIWTVDR